MVLTCIVYKYAFQCVFQLKFTVIKKEGGTVVPITYLAPAAFALHVINAHEVGEDIVLDVCEFTDLPRANG